MSAYLVRSPLADQEQDYVLEVRAISPIHELQALREVGSSRRSSRQTT